MSEFSISENLSNMTIRDTARHHYSNDFFPMRSYQFHGEATPELILTYEDPVTGKKKENCVYVCTKCGALTMDMMDHSDWHYADIERQSRLDKVYKLYKRYRR